jgi:hypothetical protein
LATARIGRSRPEIDHRSRYQHFARRRSARNLRADVGERSAGSRRIPFADVDADPERDLRPLGHCRHRAAAPHGAAGAVERRHQPPIAELDRLPSPCRDLALEHPPQMVAIRCPGVGPDRHDGGQDVVA